jgi:hypothetical protein
VRVSWSNQPAPFPMPNAAPPPRTAATRVTATRGPTRTELTVAAPIDGSRGGWLEKDRLDRRKFQGLTTSPLTQPWPKHFEHLKSLVLSS